MQNNKEIVLRDKNLEIIDKRIRNLKTGPTTVGYKIKNKYGIIWLNSNQFETLFSECGGEQDLF